MISHFELHYFVKPSENAFLDYPHHVKTTKCHKEENKHDEAGKMQVVGNSIPAGGNHMYFQKTMKTAVARHILEKKCFY